MSNSNTRRAFMKSALVAAVAAEEASAGFLNLRGRNRRHVTVPKQNYQEWSIPGAGTFYVVDNPEAKDGALTFGTPTKNAIIHGDYNLVSTIGSTYRPRKDSLEGVTTRYVVAQAIVNGANDLVFNTNTNGHQTSIISAGREALKGRNLKRTKAGNEHVINNRVKERKERIPSVAVTQVIDGKKVTDEFYPLPLGKAAYAALIPTELQDRVLPVVLLSEDMQTDPLIHRPSENVWQVEHRYNGRAFLIGTGHLIDEPAPAKPNPDEFKGPQAKSVTPGTVDTITK